MKALDYVRSSKYSLVGLAKATLLKEYFETISRQYSNYHEFDFTEEDSADDIIMSICLEYYNEGEIQLIKDSSCPTTKKEYKMDCEMAMAQEHYRNVCEYIRQSWIKIQDSERYTEYFFKFPMVKLQHSL